MILKDGRPWLSFGVMGGDNQAQAHAQVVPTSSTSACTCRRPATPRACATWGKSWPLESGIGAERAQALEAKGHTIVDGRGSMGGYQAIFIDPKTGVLLGGSDLAERRTSDRMVTNRVLCDRC